MVKSRLEVIHSWMVLKFKFPYPCVQLQPLLSQIVICGECGEMFRRIHWNNRGCKSIVWENHFTVELKSGLNIDIEG